MLSTGIYFQLFEHRASQRTARQHATNRRLDSTLWGFLDQFFKANGFQTTDVTRVVVIHFVLCLITANAYFLRIDHNNIVASINMRSVLRLVLAAQTSGNLSGHTAQSFTFCINNKPVAFDSFRLSYVSFHLNLPLYKLRAFPFSEGPT